MKVKVDDLLICSLFGSQTPQLPTSRPAVFSEFVRMNISVFPPSSTVLLESGRITRVEHAHFDSQVGWVYTITGGSQVQGTFLCPL